MKKNYLLLFCITSSFIISSQSAKTLNELKDFEYLNFPYKPLIRTLQKSILYSNTFSSAGDWVIGHDASACNLDWQIGVGLSCTGSYPIQDIVSTTASDGYALIDSDAYGGATGGTEVEDSWITMANPVDLNGYPNVVVEFETNYRSYNSENPFIVIGIGDGTGNVVWPDLDPTTDISTISNVFEAFPGFGVGDETTNPELIQVNISSALAGLNVTELSDIYVRFHWTGTWGYAWFVDDMKIIETPDNDIRNLSSYIYENNGDGVEYGRTPLSQLPSNYTIGASVFNFGIFDQTNVSLVANFIGPSNFSSNSSISLIENDSTVVLESDEILSLQIGVYNGTFTVTSDNDTINGVNALNNSLDRNFEITSDIYSLDGIGNHPTSLQQLSSLGTPSFTDGADGLVCATMYPFKNNDTINSVIALITTTTSANAEVILYIVDSLSFTSGSLNNAIFISDLYTVTAQDVANGFIEIPVGNISSNGQLFESLPIQPGNYYAALELFSGGNTYDIRIIDDETVGQPAWSSAIFIPQDQAYTNGNAFAISMNLGDNTVPNTTGIIENNNTISIYPNPSNGEFNIAASSNELSDLTVKDITGKIVISKVFSSNAIINLNNYAKGVYVVDIKNKKGIFTQKIFLQ